jgi:hypothetical protein
MKNKVLQIVLLMCFSLVQSQTVSVEELSNYIAGNVEGDFEYDTLRDISGIYDDYLGHWSYTSANDQIDFFITKELMQFFGKSYEYLTVRYEVRRNGIIVLSTVGLPVDNFNVVRAPAYYKNGFFFGAFYTGLPCHKGGGLYFKYSTEMEFSSGNIIEKLDVFPHYTRYASPEDNCNNNYISPFPDYFIMERM